MPGFFQQFLNQVGSGYREADKRLGGWLPGGGTAAPPVRVFQSATPVAGRLAGKIRDAAIIPVIDKGIQSNILPTKEAMFARYLTGTSKPLTVFPEPLLNKISNAYDQAVIEQTRNDVDKIFKQSPSFLQYKNTQTEVDNLSKELRERAEMYGREPSFKEQERITQYEQKLDKLRQSLNLPDYNLPHDRIPRTTLGDKERLEIVKQHNLIKPGNVVFGTVAAYSKVPEEIQLSLGRFNIKNNTINDRYDFDYLEKGREYIYGQGSVYPDAAGGGELASDLIELGLKKGIINPSSGYDIKIPYKK
jgi:hypothetical protein